MSPYREPSPPAVGPEMKEKWKMSRTTRIGARGLAWSVMVSAMGFAKDREWVGANTGTCFVFAGAAMLVLLVISTIAEIETALHEQEQRRK